MKRFPIVIVTALILTAPVFADVERPEVALPLMDAAPTIDGAIAEDEWAGASRHEGMYSRRLQRLGDRYVRFWTGADDANLYLAIDSEIPPDGLLTRAVPDGDRDITAATRDSTIELIIHPHLGATAGDRRLFHIITNDRGAMYDRSIDEGNPQNPVDFNWRLKNHQFATGQHEGRWHVEFAIPFSEIGATEADLLHPWGLRVGRNYKRPGDQQCWEHMGVAYTDIPTMPRINFTDGAPVVRVMSLRGEDAPRIELAIANPGEQPLPVSAFIADTWHSNPPDEFAQDVTVAPGAEERLVFEPRHGGPEGEHHTIIRVVGADASDVYYLREFFWRLEQPPVEERWTVTREDRKAVALQYAVYPYYDRALVRVDINALASKDNATGVEVSFAAKGSDEPLAAAELTFDRYVAQAELDLPELAAGDYEIRAALQGQGVPAEPVVQKYERIVFDWEHNDLGMSDIIVPPFTPIEVEGSIVSTILRDHEVGASGVWEQVTSQEAPLLKAPMRWRVWSGGEELEVSSPGNGSADTQGHRAQSEGGFTAGPLAATVRSEWDYDGMAKTFVTVDEAAGESIDRLSLEIPLDDGLCGYMHAVGDGLRHNYAGFTPEGEGAIWDSSQANTRDIIGTFYPYVWLGDGEKGLAWFADSDRGWSLDGETPTVQLERVDGTLLLRINFITRPTSLDDERQIVFGLQATPAKPMPQEPVNWRRWVPAHFEDVDMQPYRIMGSNPYYGCLAFDFYPLGRDYSIYDAFSEARDTGEYNEEFVEQWMPKYKEYGIEEGTDEWTHYLNHIRAGMRTAAGVTREDGWLWTPYTNPRGIGFHLEEWPVFQDEWIRSQFHERSTSGRIGYDIDPTESFRDAAVWYYREMLRCFDGIYWDNIYMAANTDTIGGDAWVDEDGRTHPSMGLWNMRELIRRTAVFLHEQGQTHYANVPHMTNTCVVPILSFATVNLDWEWQYGKRDFQDRFTPDLAVAETIGRSCGNIPMILGGGHTRPDDPAYEWMQRTRLGVCLVHEIRPWDYRPEFHWEMMRRLYEFGYGSEECAVYNYWQKDFPLTIEGADARGIVMVTGDRAICVATDYGEGGDCTLTLDLDALGLPATVTPTDFETGDAVTCNAPGTASFPLKKHDFKVVLFE